MLGPQIWFFDVVVDEDSDAGVCGLGRHVIGSLGGAGGVAVLHGGGERSWDGTAVWGWCVRGGDSGGVGRGVRVWVR